MNAKLLIATGDKAELAKLREAVVPLGVSVLEADNASSVLNRLKESDLFLIILDSSMPDCDGMKLLAEAGKRNKAVSIIFMVGQDEENEIPEGALRLGANDYLVKPWSQNELRTRIEKLLAKWRLTRTGRIKGNSRVVSDLLESILLVAPTRMTVLVTGESGTGKDLVARSIHDFGSRAGEPFFPINCGAIPESLLESELFGHEKGAFTGAHEMKPGKFELAGKGTIFLDEIGEMPLSLQVKLLRVLEEYRIMRVGGTREIPVEARIVAASNRNLEEEIRAGRFRKDLFYRLKIIQIDVLPLRDRPEDIPLLMNLFKEEFEKSQEVKHPGFTSEAVKALVRYSWPGNVRELKSLVDSTLIFNPDNMIQPEDLPDYIYSVPEKNPLLPAVVDRPRDELEREIIYKTLLALRDELAEVKGMVKVLISENGIRSDRSGLGEPVGFEQDIFSRGNRGEREVRTGEGRGETEAEIEDLSLEDMEMDIIRKALQANRGNRKNTAVALGIGERTLYRKIKKYGL